MARAGRILLLLATGAVAVAGLGARRTAQEASQPAAVPPLSQPAMAPATRPALGEPLDLVPAESLLCWYGRPFPDTTPLSDDASTFGTMLQLGTRLAGSSLDPQTKLYARIVEAFGLAIRYPHVRVLIDARAKPIDSERPGPRVDRLRFAAIVQAEGQDHAFKRVIQAAVNEQTDTQRATLSRKQAGTWSYQELWDRRLPDWSVVAWGEIGPYFVITVGQDVWPSIAAVASSAAPALSDVDWLDSVRGERGRHALIEIIVAAQDIRERLDPFVDGRATDFFRAWHAENLERAHWALGFEGPALYCVAHFMEEGHVRERVYADPSIRDPRLFAVIPETARYAIYRVVPQQVVPAFVSSLLATQGRDTREHAEKLWARIQAEQGFDAQRDILAHLGEHIVMHNDPPHPLRIPLAMTTLTEIRDEPQRVRQTIDAMCQAWQEVQTARVEKTGMPNVPSLERDGDGIWYLQFGPLAGPAWVVTERFIITSWSPVALRGYLEKVGDRAGRWEK
jgi:hypothetical protein